MTEWVDASTDEYWGGDYGWPNGSDFTYLGGGIWEFGAGPGVQKLLEQSSSPLAGDPYDEYAPGETVYGIRFTVAFTAYDNGVSGGTVTANVYTSTTGYGSYTDRVLTDSDDWPAGVRHTKTFTFQWNDALVGERPVYIMIEGQIGTYYGDDPWLSNIQVLMGGAPPVFWQDYRGVEERCIT